MGFVCAHSNLMAIHFVNTPSANLIAALGYLNAPLASWHNLPEGSPCPSLEYLRISSLPISENDYEEISDLVEHLHHFLERRPKLTVELDVEFYNDEDLPAPGGRSRLRKLFAEFGTPVSVLRPATLMPLSDMFPSNDD